MSVKSVVHRKTNNRYQRGRLSVATVSIGVVFFVYWAGNALILPVYDSVEIQERKIVLESKKSRNNPLQHFDVEEMPFAPPLGYPWHHWPEAGINSSSLLDMMNKENQNALKCLNYNMAAKDGTCQQQLHRIPFILKNGTVWTSRSKYVMLIRSRKTVTSRLTTFYHMLKYALDIAKPHKRANPKIKEFLDKELPFVLHKGDKSDCSAVEPILTWSRMYNQTACKTTFPIPSYYLWAAVAKKSPGAWDEAFAKWNDLYPWSSKTQKALWIGSPTGHLSEPWQNVPRVKLVLHSMERPDLIDARLTRTRPEDDTEMRKHLQFSKRIEQDRFMEYAAIIDIDGNSWSSRFANLLCYNSIVLKVQPNNVDYFHSELYPWTHYVPVDQDMQNLFNVTQFVLAPENKNQTQQIIRNANNWCKRKLVYEQLASDLLWILIAYMEMLDNFNSNWREDWETMNLTGLGIQPVDALVGDPFIRDHSRFSPT